MSETTARRGIRVAVVGGGPTGLAATILLRQAGIDVTLLEQKPGTAQLPQAHQINGRTGEVLHQMGVFDELDRLAPPDTITRNIVWATAMDGIEFGGVMWPAWDPDLSAFRALNVGQDIVERVLADRAAEIGYHGGFSRRVTNLTQDAEKVTIAYSDGEGAGHLEEFDYVLACDGAGSPLRRILGIEMEGPPSLSLMATAYFRAPLFDRIKHRPGALRVLAGQDAWGTIIGYDIDSTWAFMCGIPEGTDPSEYTMEVMREFVSRGIGDHSVDFDILALTTWNMSAQVAPDFRSGRVFLLGDAAHRFPPTGGLGLNTGVLDAQNIAWKLGLIDRGIAGEELLDTYSAERQPAGLRNCEQSVVNAMRFASLDPILGTGPLSPLPPQKASEPLTPPPDPDDPAEIARRAAAQMAFDSFIGAIDFASIEFGYVYGGPPEDDELPPFEPHPVKGGLLPHLTIGDGVGLLDLYEKDIPTLFVVDERSPWGARAGELATAIGLPLHQVTIRGLGDEAVERWAQKMDGADAILVRPDGHVAWVSVGDDADAALSGALQTIVGAPALQTS